MKTAAINPALLTQDTIERFWEKVNITDDPDECWNWKRVGKAKYGHFYAYQSDGKPVFRSAHRVSWVIANHADVPRGLGVLHKCDNPKCVNPNHLFIGTQQQNFDDQKAKGRQSKHRRLRGRDHGRAKLTDADVVQIRKRRLSGETLASLAAAYNMHNSTISAICHHRIWSHIA